MSDFSHDEKFNKIIEGINQSLLLIKNCEDSKKNVKSESTQNVMNSSENEDSNKNQ